MPNRQLPFRARYHREKLSAIDQRPTAEIFQQDRLLRLLADQKANLNRPHHASREHKRDVVRISELPVFIVNLVQINLTAILAD
jgi:hypothetical protein